MTNQTKSLWCFTLSLAVLFVMMSCAGKPPIVAVPEQPNRTRYGHDEQQDRSAVHLTAFCGLQVTGFGSGVIVGRRLLITARHVVRVNYRVGPFFVSQDCPHVASVLAETYDGKKYIYTLYAQGRGDVDIAWMRTKENVNSKYVTKIRQAKPPIGAMVCSSTAHPKRYRRCGRVYKHKDGRVWYPSKATAGNSGSGVYDTNGRFVGLLTHGVSCGPGKPYDCGTIVDTRIFQIQ